MEDCEACCWLHGHHRARDDEQNVSLNARRESRTEN
ncbi:MAG: hypothetical protein H6978_12110 [Gammaproteobacteria bacterium]|nr:hypothetical protein [Gammaproteobacteria bacterium]